MKYIFILSIFFSSSMSSAGLILKTEGHLMQKTKQFIALESKNTRYKVRLPANTKTPFLLKKIKGHLYSLEADSTLILSKKRVKNPKGVK